MRCTNNNGESDGGSVYSGRLNSSHKTERMLRPMYHDAASVTYDSNDFTQLHCVS